MSGQTIHLVPHTHWDREWYEPFQRFRLRLVDLLDDVVARAEADPTFHFTLDGQLAAVDDFLEVRPEAEPRIAALVHSGQFAVGPWAILLDEFLCSGENIVRNLERGLVRARALGGAMRVGYLPDMFGHCAQMPQILALAAVRTGCVWRGVPASVNHHAFVWRAPDGTGMRTEYLPGGYGNAAEMLADPDGLARAVTEYIERMRDWYGDDPILAMYGTDHSAPLPWLTRAVASLDGAVPLQLATLQQYLQLFNPLDTDDLPVCEGELRSHARANILPGVLSNRPHLKQALSQAERMVERYAEPLAALWSPPAKWPDRLLDMAWKRLIECSCHDSVTGCGVDETAIQVAARIAEAEQIGRGVRDRTLDGLAGAAPAGSVVVVNPSPWPHTPVVELDLPVAGRTGPVTVYLPDGTALPTQEIRATQAEPLYEARRPADDLADVLRKGSLGLDFLGRRVQSVEPGEDRVLTVTVGALGDGITVTHRRLADRIVAAGGDWTVRVFEESRRLVYAPVPLPPLGFTTVRAAAGVPPVVGAAVLVGEKSLSNSLLSVAVASDGTLDLEAADGTRALRVGRLVDGGDVGDLYNYGPPPDDRLVDVPDEVSVRVLDNGSLVGSLEVMRTYSWARVRTVVELRAGEPFCRLAVDFDNRNPDHRVRLHVPLPEPATHSHAEGQFAVVRRGLTSEGGHGEVPIPTFPAYGFVDAGGVAILLDQVSEYELVSLTPSGGERMGLTPSGGERMGNARELALTLLRATGLISRPDHPLRAEPAGPVIATPLAQCIGPVNTSLAVYPHAAGWSAAGVLRAAEQFRCPPVTVGGIGVESLEPLREAGLAVEGDGVVLSSLRRRGDWLELRVVALTGEPTAAVVTGRFTQARRADLLGRPGAPLSTVDGQVTVRLRGWEISTVQLLPSP